MIARVAGLVTQNERTVMRERALRLANLALVKATTPEEIATAALGTAQALVAGVGEARVCVERPDGLVPMTATQGGVHDTLSPGAVTLLELAAILPNEPVALPAAVHAELDLPAAAQRANVFPLAARGERRGLLIAAASTPLSPIIVEALDALSASVSLALESAALIEQVHRRENEARFALAGAQRQRRHHRRRRDGRVALPEPVDRADPRFTPTRSPANLFEDLLIAGDRGLLRKVLQTQRRRRWIACLRVHASATATDGR